MNFDDEFRCVLQLPLLLILRLNFVELNFDDLNLMAAQLLLDSDRSQPRDAFDQRCWTGKVMVVPHTPQIVVTYYLCLPAGPGRLFSCFNRVGCSSNAR